MKKRILSVLTAAAMIVPAAQGMVFPTAHAAETADVVVRLDPSDASPFNNGEFQGWGTSLCWWANRVGYSEKMTQQAADLFFSEGGLGLDIARYNLGGGDDPAHNHITRSDSKVPGYATGFDADGNIVYDWTVDENQRNIAKAALKANPDLYFEGFSNSPPYFMTNSGCSSGATNAGDDNLKSDQYDNFGKFIAEATKHFKEEFGITFESYSPMNEPDTTYWGAMSPKQEGCHFSPGTTQSNTIIATRKALDAAGLTDVLVAGMDETDINKSVTNYAQLTDEAKTALGRIDTHTYSGSNRAGLKATAIAANKDLWMSEVDGGWDGFGLAQRIILDMNGMQPAAWVMWDIIDKHKDSQFTAPDGSKPEANNTLNATDSLWGVGMADHDTETLHLANKYYFFGQFTKYINPGDTIIASSNNTLAAYNRNTGAIKIVALNSSSSDAKYMFDMSAFAQTGDTAVAIRTNNSDEKWKTVGIEKLVDKKLSYTLPAKSITTFVIDNGAVINQFKADNTGLSYSYDVSDGLNGYNKYFAVYDNNGVLKYVSLNENSGELSGDFTGCTPKLYVWDGMKPVIDAVDTVGAAEYENKYGIIKGGGSQISRGASVTLSLNTNIEGDVVWSSSDESVATVAQDGTVTAVACGNVTIYAKIGDFVTSRDFEIPMYTLTGTASWGNDSNRPSDSADYTRVADGNFSTYFDGTTGGWVQYDYGTVFRVKEIKLAARSGNGMPERTVGGTIQGSLDGITWTELYKITSAIPANEYTTIPASQLKNNDYRYFRYINNDNMANIAEFLISGEPVDIIPEDPYYPNITDLAEFTDNFESNDNIFNASNGAMSDGGNVVFNSGLERFGNAFAPVKDTASSALTTPVTLTNKNKFRLRFNMFAGWENNGKDNTFVLKDKDGKELVALYMTGGGYNFNQIRIGGENVLSGTTVAQCRSNPGTSKAGANGWNASGQSYVNTVGYNKTVEIIIDGTGAVSVSATGGMADTTVTGTISTPITLGSIELKGDYNSAAERTVSYDNLDGDIITYKEALAEPTAPPAPTDAPVLPENGELINLSFDNGDLTSTSSYGKAAALGTAVFETVDNKKCLKFDGTNATAIKLTDANGNSLLTGLDEITVSFKVKPTATTASWLLFAAPNDSAQTYQKENYLGIRTQNEIVHTERYKNNGSRSAEIAGAVRQNEWNDVIISVEQGATTVYVNGMLADKQSSTVSLSDMLGKASVAYIGKANWGSGEYATGYLDDFVITKGALENPLADISLGNTTDVTENIAVPAIEDVSWETSDANVVTAAGVITRADETKTATLTAKTTVNGINFLKEFTVTVLGKAAALDSFVAYAENGSIKFTSDYDSTKTPYSVSVTLASAGEGVTTVDQKDNVASGSFDSVANGTYKVGCTLKNGTETVKTVTRTVTVKEEQEMGAYLFAHFVGNESDASHEQIYFSVSTDGTTWTTLNNGSPVLTSNVGENGVRDPYILRGEDGKFFVIATDLSIYNRRDDSNRWGTCQTSGSKSIVIWESSDLVNWSQANLVQVAPDNAGCTWAPEAVYDPEVGKYMVFWASKTSTDNYATQRMYRSYTSDFKTFTEPEVYIDGGNISNIDTTIIQDKGMYYRFTKNESKSSVTMMKCATLSGDWKDVETYTINDAAGNTVTGYEGPTIYKINGENKWCLLLDYYSKNQGYKPFVTTDLANGTFKSASDFNFGTTKFRHGTVMPITTAEYNALIAEYGNNN